MKYPEDKFMFVVFAVATVLITSISIWYGCATGTLSKVLFAGAANLFSAGAVIALCLLTKKWSVGFAIVVVVSIISVSAQRAFGLTETPIVLTYGIYVGIGAMVLRRSGHFDQFT